MKSASSDSPRLGLRRAKLTRLPNVGGAGVLWFILALAGAITVAMAQPAGTFTATGNMTTARAEHTATLLTNGKVLIAGGLSFGFPESILASAELYDPSTGTFTRTGDMTTARGGHSAILLPDGRVLMLGGSGNTSVE